MFAAAAVHELVSSSGGCCLRDTQQLQGLKMAVAFAGNSTAIQEMFKRRQVEVPSI